MPIDQVAWTIDVRTGLRGRRPRSAAYGARQAQRELQAEAAVQKPFSPDALVEKLRSLVPSAA